MDIRPAFDLSRLEVEVKQTQCPFCGKTLALYNIARDEALNVLALKYYCSGCRMHYIIVPLGIISDLSD